MCRRARRITVCHPKISKAKFLQLFLKTSMQFVASAKILFKCSLHFTGANGPAFTLPRCIVRALKKKVAVPQMIAALK